MNHHAYMNMQDELAFLEYICVFQESKKQSIKNRIETRLLRERERYEKSRRSRWREMEERRDWLYREGEEGVCVSQSNHDMVVSGVPIPSIIAFAPLLIYS